MEERRTATARATAVRAARAHLDAEAAYDAAARSRHPGERVLADTLDTLIWIADAAVVFTSAVEAGRPAAVTMLLRASGHERAATQRLLAGLPQLEPIDPFGPRRAAATGATVLTVADAGGSEAYARSPHGRHLRRAGYGAPAVMHLRRAGAITCSVTLLRAAEAPPFAPPVLRRLDQFHPLLEHALAVAADPCAPAAAPTVLAGSLTAREAEIAERVAGGVSNAGIAAALGVREATVKTHLTSVYAKLGVRSRTQLALLVNRTG